MTVVSPTEKSREFICNVTSCIRLNGRFGEMACAAEKSSHAATLLGVTLQMALLFDKAGIWLFVGAILYLFLGSFSATQAADLIGV